MEIARYPLLAAGIVFLIYGLWGLFRALRLSRVCTGVVVGYEKHPDENALFAPRIEFASADGIRHIFLSQLYGERDIPVGGHIRIRYSPKEPERAEVACFSALWLFPLVSLGFGVGFLLVGILTPRQSGSAGDF